MERYLETAEQQLAGDPQSIASCLERCLTAFTQIDAKDGPTIRYVEVPADQVANVDGYEVCRRLKSDPETRLIPVVFLTGQAGREARLAGLDAGATDTGRPYFVMELVKGLPITQYCDEQHLTPRERLELFLPICQAIQHAHQKGIIHRDIKPSNVLIQEVDGKPVPKIIDFGVAKAVAPRADHTPLATGIGVLVGTPEYMSPEQADLDSPDLDTRSDVYSLGVVLYELLIGARPFDPDGERKIGLEELRRRIRDDHLDNDGQTHHVVEHTLGTGKTDADRPVLEGTAGVVRSIRVGHDL